MSLTLSFLSSACGGCALRLSAYTTLKEASNVTISNPVLLFVPPPPLFKKLAHLSVNITFSSHLMQDLSTAEMQPFFSPSSPSPSPSASPSASHPPVVLMMKAH